MRCAFRIACRAPARKLIATARAMPLWALLDSTATASFSTLLACMGVAPTHPAIESQPGSGQLILSPSRIREIRQQYQPSSPGDRIPLPPPRPQIRGDNSDGAIPSGQGYQETGATPGYAQAGATFVPNE